MRWAPDARGRLERAALELFTEQGYAETTVPQITARAGLTTRTFFRHFADKRDVVFAGDEIPEIAARFVREAPPGLAPIEVVRAVLHRVAAERFGDTHQRAGTHHRAGAHEAAAGQQARARVHEQVAAWRRLIDSEDALRDRDARKRADMVRATRAAFVERGAPDLLGTVYAELGVLVFQVALERWAAGRGTRPMSAVMDEVLAATAGALA